MTALYAPAARRSLLLSLLFLLTLTSARAEGVAAARIYTRGGESFRLYVDGAPMGTPANSFVLPQLTGGYHWLEFRFPGRRLGPGVQGYRTQAWFAPDFESVYELDAFPSGGRMTLTRVSYAMLGGGGSGYANNYTNQGGTGAAPQCAGLFTPAEVDQFVQSLRDRDFENTRLTMAKDAVNRGSILAQDVKRIMKVFDFEASRLEFAKHAYNRCCDQRNYYVVNDAFDFDASVQSLQRYTNGGR